MMGNFDDITDQMSQLIGMNEQGNESPYAQQADLPMGDPVAENLNPLWGPDGEPLGSTYGAEEEPIDEMGMGGMGMDETGMVGIGLGESGNLEEPRETPEDLRDAYLYQMQADSDRSAEFQEATVDANEKTKRKAREIRGVGL